jgi:nucleotide-binding universal stress UspA family protein
MSTTWNPIVAGVDASPEGALAATVGWSIAGAANCPCYLVHAVRDPGVEIAARQLPIDLGPMGRRLAELARADVVEALLGSVPPELLSRLELGTGHAATVLAEAAASHGAEAVVVGGKHHSALGRWFAGSTVHDLLRISPVPVLVAVPSLQAPRRILAAVDLSDAARPTLHWAQRFAELFEAELLVLHVVEPLPLLLQATIMPDPALQPAAILEQSQTAFEETVWPLVHYARADFLLRSGPLLQTVRDQVTTWNADLLVVGSHGKGFMNRLLVGSTTHRLADDLPAATLVVPWLTLARRPERTAAWMTEPVTI